MKQFLITVAGVLVGGFLLFFLPLFFIIMLSSIISTVTSGGKVDSNTVLVYNLETSVPDFNGVDPMESLSMALSGEKNETLTLSKLLRSLNAAATDDNISCLVLKGSTSGASYANMKEILPYLEAFKETGKPIYYFDNSLDQSALYLASVADSVFVVPESMVMIYGLTATHIYYKNAMEKFGIDMQVIRHGKYKSAVEPYITDHMSEASREQTQKYLDAIWSDMRSVIAENREISTQSIDQYASGLDFANTQAAIDAHLIDRCIYRDEFIAKLKEITDTDADDDLKAMSIANYSNTIDTYTNNSDNKIALIYAQGEILDGTSEGSTSDIYGDDLARTIRKARTDDDVKAIVLRVNSPGGSALASDIIWREVKLASETKPTIVSMGQYAASGGYYISCAANHIFAEPNTITGSIGIFGVIPCVKKAANNIGLTFDTVSTYDDGEPSLYEPLSEGWTNFFQKRIESGYQTFISRCADGRHTTTEHIDSIGQGRVWAGTDAITIGLVDELGSLDDAIDYAAEMADISDYSIDELPVIDDSFAALMKQLGTNARVSVGELIVGESYSTIERLKKMSTTPSIQTRMEYDVMIR